MPLHLQSQNNKESFLDRFKVVAAELDCSQTVVAHISKDGHYFIHPDILQNRSLTPREVARLQTFPDDYYVQTPHYIIVAISIIFYQHSFNAFATFSAKQTGTALPICLYAVVLDGFPDTDSK